MKKTTLLFSGLMLMSIIAFAKEYRYTFHTSCGTTVVVNSQTNYSNSQLENMMEMYNQSDCGETAGEIDIIRP